MPYRKVGNCVYKGKEKIGCSDNVEEYLKALYANTKDESIEEIIQEIKDYFLSREDKDYMRYNNHPLSTTEKLLDENEAAPWDDEYEDPVK